jgi:DegV family protein with EDD domain
MFQLLTDTACDLSFDYLDENSVGYIGFTVTIDGVEYRTDEAELTSEYLLELIRQGKEPTTSQVNIGQFVEFFKKYIKEKKPLLYLGFSSGLSGTYQSALQAVKIVKKEYIDAQIIVIDTKAAANGMAILIKRAVQMRDKGVSVDETVKELEKLILCVRSWVTVDDLHHLERGGRISKATAMIGTVLNIKPIIDVDVFGKLRQVGKMRGWKKALKYLADCTIEDLDTSIKQKIFICYSGNKESAELLKKMIMEVSDIQEFEVNHLGPTIMTHTGAGAIAIFFIAKEARN